MALWLQRVIFEPPYDNENRIMVHGAATYQINDSLKTHLFYSTNSIHFYTQVTFYGSVTRLSLSCAFVGGVFPRGWGANNLPSGRGNGQAVAVCAVTV